MYISTGCVNCRVRPLRIENKKEKKKTVVTMKQEEESKLDNIKKNMARRVISEYNFAKFWK